MIDGKNHVNVNIWRKYVGEGRRRKRRFLYVYVKTCVERWKKRRERGNLLAVNCM